MAKVKGPLFSLSASGAFNGIVEYRTTGGQTIAAGIKAYVPPRTPAQAAQTNRFKDAVGGWRTASPEQKAAWNAAAPATTTGYRYYLSEYILQNVQPPGHPLLP